MANPGKPYSGILTQPVWAGGGGLLFSPEQAAAHQAADIEARFDALFIHYEIDKADQDRWRKLAVALAFQHVPGLEFIVSTKPRRGRPKKWTDSFCLELWAATVKKQRESPRLSEERALTWVVKRDPRFKDVGKKPYTRLCEWRSQSRMVRVLRLVDPDERALDTLVKIFGPENPE